MITRKLIWITKDPLLLLAFFILTVGFIGAAFSWGVPTPLTQDSPGVPQSGSALNVTVSDGFDQSQTINPQVSGQTNGDVSSSPTNPSTAPSPVPTPPEYVEPPVYPPCNFCSPTAGHACPLYQVYPCTPCTITPRSDMACEDPEY